MTIMLKGIDLPEDGGTIVLKIKGSKIYQEYPSRYKFQPTRIKDAKVIQIPKDHGDIKDVRNIIKKFDENIALAKAKPTEMYADAFLDDALEWSAEYITIKDDIDNAPTILEAEE